MQNRTKSFLVSGVEVSAPPLEPGLYLVATPIGNLADITIRALNVLAAADVIAAEDTRVTRVLLSRYAIAQKPTAYHEHNAKTAGPVLLDAAESGKSVALVSDAGTPLVSDPGFRLVEEAVERHLPVIPIPGASASIAALTASGLPTDSFLFIGFLPVKPGPRSRKLASLAATDATLVFYESPRRLADALAAMEKELGGDRQCAVARELTKRFEEFRRGSLSELSVHYASADTPKGEVVICVGPPQQSDVMSQQDEDALLASLVAEMPVSRAASEAARLTGRSKRELYARLLAMKPGKQ